MPKGRWFRTEEFREGQRQLALAAYERNLAQYGRKVLKCYNTGKTLEEIHGEEKAQEIRAKISKSTKGVPKPLSHGIHVSASSRGKPKSEEHRNKLRGKRPLEVCRKISEAASRRTPEQKEERLRKFLISLDQNGGREKISKAHRNKIVSDETRAKQVISRTKTKFPYNNSKPELATHAYLSSNGVEFEKHIRLDFYKLHAYDIVIRDKKVIIEVDGCYWHGCPKHYPGSCIEQINRDQLHTSVAEKNEWVVIRIWEHEIKSGDFSKLSTLIGRTGDGKSCAA